MKKGIEENVKAAVGILAALFLVFGLCALATRPVDTDRLIEEANEHFDSMTTHAEAASWEWRIAKKQVAESMNLGADPDGIDFARKGGRDYLVYGTGPSTDRVEITDTTTKEALSRMRKHEKAYGRERQLYFALLNDAYTPRDEAMFGAFFYGTAVSGVLLAICLIVVATNRHDRENCQA